MSCKKGKMTKKIKKISSLSIMVMVMGGTIGAGIFFKNQSLSKMAQGNFGIVMATWGVGIIAMLALALALVEVTSAQKTDKGTLEWLKLFCPKWIFNSSSNYLKWIFVPITLFTIPVYLTFALEDAGLPLKEEWHALLFSFGVFIWFMIINLFSLKYSEISQWIFTILQTVPLIIFPIIGFINAGDVDGTILEKNVEAQQGLTGASPWLATIAGISAIAFAYDGFYASASLRNDMKEPNKIGWGLAGGIIGISIVYLFLTIGINMAGDGSSTGLKDFLPDWLFRLLNTFIAIGIMGVVNTYAMASPRQFKDSADQNESPEIIWFQKLIFRKKYSNQSSKQRYLAAWWWIIATTTLFFIILGPIGSYVYTPASFAYGETPFGKVYAGNFLYGFSDVLTNFTSLLVFIILATIILGALINRKTNKVHVTKSKFFVPCAIITIVINYIAGLYMIIESIVGMTGFNGADIIGNVVLFLVFISFLAISIISGLFQTYRFNKKITPKIESNKI